MAAVSQLIKYFIAFRYSTQQGFHSTAKTEWRIFFLLQSGLVIVIHVFMTHSLAYCNSLYLGMKPLTSKQLQPIQNSAEQGPLRAHHQSALLPSLAFFVKFNFTAFISLGLAQVTWGTASLCVIMTFHTSYVPFYQTTVKLKNETCVCRRQHFLSNQPTNLEFTPGRDEDGHKSYILWSRM